MCAKTLDFETFVKRYKPIEFSLLGLTIREHIPGGSFGLLDSLRAEWISIKSSLNRPATYFDVRFTLTPDGKKRADMAFLTHVIQKCATDDQNTPRIRYYMTKLRYFAELRYIDGHIGTKQADTYMLRWGYLLEHDPSFDELVHGTSVESALYAIENLN